MKRGADVMLTEAFHAATVDIYAANDVLLAGRGAALQPDMFHY